MPSKRPKKKKKKTSSTKTRSWAAIIAWFRNSAGPMKNKKKEKSAKHCRKWKKQDEE